MRKRAAGKKALLSLCLVGGTVLMLLSACGKENTFKNADTTSQLPAGVHLASCPSTTTNVIMQNEAFSPATITVEPNTIVKWTNQDATGTYWIIMGAFESPRVDPGQHICIKFTEPGTFEYHCDPTVRGTVIVKTLAQ